ncbi:tyrosine-type recombinase/integrase [Candidatus Pacearchaeota archaeon]|nr:tyrosine-type recombinase/integrase [Candidatus Pacearchaeota archaeon]
MSYIPVNIEEAIKKECYRRRLSPRTAETYLSCIERFMKWTKKDIRYISKKDVRLFLEYLSEKNSAGSTMNVYHMALRFLFENVLEKRMWIDIKYSKTPKRLPEFLTKEETKKLIDSIINFKHQLMICLMYSAGLRVSELLNLKVKDLELDKEKFAKTNFSQKLQTSHEENLAENNKKIDYAKFSKEYGFVRNGKGGKDRIIIVAKNLVPAIKKLIERENLIDENYLFQSNRNERYSSRTIQQIIKKAIKISGIKKKIHPHSLRHSFATHLIENENSLSEVQSLLGHKSPETTLIYTHMISPTMINIKSPLESL